jgi:hypothetical protein
MRINLNNVDLCFNVVGVVCYLVIVPSGDGSANPMGFIYHLSPIWRFANRADMVYEVLGDLLILLVVLYERGALVRLLLILVMMG